jgi:ubiquinone/menaquinone biosynthesis C-methylase UbiE
MKKIYTYISGGKKIHQEYFYENFKDKYPICYSIKRIASYSKQIELIYKYLGKGNLLEVGVGNKFVSNFLKNDGKEVITADISKDLNPDVVCSVTELSKHFKENNFKIVTAFEILEHLPLECIPSTLEEIYRVSSKYVILSVPRSALSYGNIELKIPLIKKININFYIPLFFVKGKINNHYWELGNRDMPLRKFKNFLMKHFTILEELAVSNHKFFILEKKENKFME